MLKTFRVNDVLDFSKNLERLALLFEFERNLDLKIEILKYFRGAGARGVAGGVRGGNSENVLC